MATSVDYEILFRVKKTQLEMIRDRGYDISDELVVLTATLAEFADRYRKQNQNFYQALSVEYTNPSNQSVYIHYSEPGLKPTTGKDQVATFINYIEGHQTPISSAILISPSKLSFVAQNLLTGLPMYFIQHFKYEELLNNPTTHYLVPKHEIISEDDMKSILKESRLTATQTPLILTTDKQAKYLGAQAGQMIRITRKFFPYPSFVDEVVFYRLVSLPPTLT